MRAFVIGCSLLLHTLFTQPTHASGNFVTLPREVDDRSTPPWRSGASPSREDIMRPFPRAHATALPCATALLVALAACAHETTTPAAITAPVASAASKSGDNQTGDDQRSAKAIEKIDHLVVIYLENHSFDNLYGEFAGANGLANAGSKATQVTLAGVPYTTLPTPPGGAFPSTLANAPFNIEQYVPASAITPDLVHRFYQEQLQIDGGKMDRFAAISDAKGLVMGYYHTANLPLAAEAAQNVLMDNFFHGAFGGSFLNHIYLIAAQAPVFPGAPAAMVAQLDAAGNLVKDGAVTPDGYVVNTSFTVNNPHPASANPATLVPNQTMPTIGDRLSEKNVSWAWYSGGWSDALAGHADPLFQYHHQPFAFFANYADGSAAKAAHLRDESEFIAKARAGTLPAVSFVKPLGEVNEHPGYTNVLSGEQHVADLLRALRASPEWKRTAVIITYDENGGFWDHVAPPKIDRWGPAVRVPTLVISPLAKHGYVDHNQYDTSSILALIEHRWGLAPLSTRDAAANDMHAAFDVKDEGRGSDR
jgi:phospholipase C